MSKKKHVYTDEVTPKRGFTITKDRQKVTWTTGNKYFLDIPRPFKEKHVMKLWCEQNCRYRVVYYNDDVNLKSSLIREFDFEKSQARMYFFSEEDAMAFKLRWL